MWIKTINSTLFNTDRALEIFVDEDPHPTLPIYSVEAVFHKEQQFLTIARFNTKVDAMVMLDNIFKALRQGATTFDVAAYLNPD